MFDDHIQKPGSQGVPPSNLPIGEPEDMFSPVEPADAAPMSEPVSPPPYQSSQPAPEPSPAASGASAVRAGVLRPAAPPQPEVAAMPQDTGELMGTPLHEPLTPPPSLTDQQMYAPHQGGKGKIVLIVIIILALLAGVGWVAYTKFFSDGSNGTATIPVVVPPVNNQEKPAEPVEDEFAETDDTTEPLDTNIIDDSLLFGQPIDQDGDALDDTREETIGTDPKNWDSDGDELGDGDEVIIWKTNPLNPDTDGDTFKDGAEVRSGYSPTGPGRLFEPPTTTSP